jgi:hypothetical protein
MATANNTINSNYKGLPSFIKQKSIVVNRAAIDHEIRLFSFPNITA